MREVEGSTGENIRRVGGVESRAVDAPSQYPGVPVDCGRLDAEHAAESSTIGRVGAARGGQGFEDWDIGMLRIRGPEHRAVFAATVALYADWRALEPIRQDGGGPRRRGAAWNHPMRSAVGLGDVAGSQGVAVRLTLI